MKIPRNVLTVSGTARLLLFKFLADRCSVFAAALSFSSLLSLVPFLALVFALLKTLEIDTALAPRLLDSVAAGSQEIVTRILRYVHNTKVGSLGVVGIGALLLSVMATLDTLEDAFNQICGLERGKAYHHKFLDYLIVIFSIPLLIVISTSITTSLQHQDVVRWFFHLPVFGRLLLALFRLTPYLSVWIALVCIYKFIPSIRISFRNALIGSLVAGTILQMAQWVYIYFQFGVTRYNAIYGTLALLPVFMVWLYTSWVVVLAGMELVWHLQQSATAELPQGRNNGRQPERHEL